MTDRDIADKVYIEPLTVSVLEQIIEKEQPDSILPTLGGQAGLNLGMELEESGFLASHNVKLLGTTAATIRKAEDRQEFKDTMEKIGERLPIPLVIQLFCVLHIPWEEAVAVLHIIKWNWRKFLKTDFAFPVWDKYWWSVVLLAGKRLSMK